MSLGGSNSVYYLWNRTTAKQTVCLRGFAGSEGPGGIMNHTIWRASWEQPCMLCHAAKGTRKVT